MFVYSRLARSAAPGCCDNAYARCFAPSRGGSPAAFRMLSMMLLMRACSLRQRVFHGTDVRRSLYASKSVPSSRISSAVLNRARGPRAALRRQMTWCLGMRSSANFRPHTAQA